MPVKRILILIVVLIFVSASCARNEAPATPRPAAEGAASPAMPLPGTATPETISDDPTVTPNVDNPFAVLIRNCYLVDPDINPVGAPDSREKGIRMVVTGSILNNTDRIIFRAGIYSKLVVYFGKNARYEKYSGGLGFEPGVTSSNPWRPGAWRDFEIVGRAFDPIYIEYEPKAISGVLSLEAKDPLGFSFSQEIAKMKPRWDTLFGVVVDQEAQVREAAVVVYGPNGAKTRLLPGENVKLVAQQGGGYLAMKDEKLAGWTPWKTLSIRRYENMYPESPARTFPMMATVEGRYEFTVADYRYLKSVDGLPDVEGGYISLNVKVKTLAQKQKLPLRPSYFWIDEGSGRHAAATDKVTGIRDALQPTNGMEIGSEVSGWIYVPRLANGWPFALVFQAARTTDPTHILLLPAVSREGSKKALAEEPAPPGDN